MPTESAREPHEDTARRLEDLEVKASYTEDLLDRLNLLVYRQQQRIDRLEEQLAQMQRQAPEAGGAAARDPRDELPPHY